MRQTRVINSVAAVLLPVFALVFVTGETQAACPCLGDMNHDGEVNGSDIQGFVDSLLFEGRVDSCADFDGSGAVEFEEISDFVTSLLETKSCGVWPHIASQWNSGCLNDGMRDYCDDDTVTFTVEGSDVRVRHHNASYNCCLQEIAFEMSLEDNVIRLTEREVVAAPCDCICCYDAETVVTGLAPGAYTVELCWQDYDLGVERCATTEILIGARVGSYSDSGCLSRSGQMWPCGEDAMSYDVEAGVLSLMHENAKYNCCRDEIVVTLEMQGNVISLTEHEVVTMPCTCTCCYNVDSTVVDLAPGTYSVEYCWFEYWAGEWECFEWEILVD